MKVRKLNDGRKKPWMLDLGLVGARRQRAFFETEGEALRALKAKREEIKALPVQMCELSIQERVDLVTMHRELTLMKITPNDALTFLRHHYKVVGVKKVSDAVVDCIASRMNSGKRAEYVKMFAKRLNGIAKHFEGRMCSSITADEIDKWARLNKRQRDKEKPLSLATVKSRLIDASTFFAYCAKWKWILENPTLLIEPIELEDKPPGIHSAETAKAFLAALLEHGPDLIGFVAPIYFGGLRPNESRTLADENVKAEFIEVSPEKSKTRQRRFIPINDTLRAWLAVPGVKYGMLPRCRRLETIKKNAGIVWSHDVLRHSFCSYSLVKYGAKDTAAHAGHSEQILFAHYRERVLPVEAERFWGLRPT